MTELEKYIANNKERLEPSEVNPKIWLSIENEMLKSKGKQQKIYLRIVSIAAVILFGAFLFEGQFFNNNTNIEKELMEVYGFQSHQFAKQVNDKKSSLSKAKVPSKHVEDFQVLLQQLDFLDEQYLVYLKQIEQHGYQSFIGDQLLNYYRSKIELLDKIQEEIKKANYYEQKFPSNDKQVGLPI